MRQDALNQNHDTVLPIKLGCKIKVLVDGRVFSTTAFDRGMGIYVNHIMSTLNAAGFDVTVLLYRNCRLSRNSQIITAYGVRFADFDPESYTADTALRTKALHGFTSYLSSLIEQDRIDIYLDSTPFLGPMRLDLFSCPVIGICYDFIPLRHPSFYLRDDAVRSVYQNGLARLTRAGGIICISDTVRCELQKYLGFDADRITTIYPRLDEVYEAGPTRDASPFERSYIFSILGSHKSKNPDRSLSIFAGLSKAKELDIRINAPTLDQHSQILSHLPKKSHVFLTGSIPLLDKGTLQAHAACVAHLSVEEGFGIPCLEAIFLGCKILALDIPINRELMKAGWNHRAGAVFLLPPDASEVSVEEFRDFLRRPMDAEFYRRIRAQFRAHWGEATGKITELIERATVRFKLWKSRLKAAIFTSLPGSNCGVADYSVAYVRSADFDFLIFCSGDNQEYLTQLPNVRVCTYLDFERFRVQHPDVTCMFNFAFSDELFPGIDLMRAHATSSDIVLIHERRYFDGLVGMMVKTGRTSDLLLEIPKDEDPARRTQLAVRYAFHPAFNPLSPDSNCESTSPSVWLKRLPTRFVSHLSPSVRQEMHALAEAHRGDMVNDLSDIEELVEFAPLGIDDRSNPGVARAAQRLRLARGIQPRDILVGHFGLILNDVKRLWDIVNAAVAFASERERSDADGRRLYFALVGKVIDGELYQRILRLFGDAGLAERLIYSNPALESDFDAEIVACDAIFCFRIQLRGQLSHVFVRALSLGVPNFVNARSGYAYDPRTTIDDSRTEGDISLALEQLFDPSIARAMRRSARQAYETTYRGENSLRAIMSGNHDE